MEAVVARPGGLIELLYLASAGGRLSAVSERVDDASLFVVTEIADSRAYFENVVHYIPYVENKKSE